MTELIKSITKYSEFAELFFKWYNVKYKSIPLNVFINLSELMQLPIIQEYLIDKYNLGSNFDIGLYIIYYYDPMLNLKEIKELSERNGRHTYTVLKKFDLPVLNYKDSFRRAIDVTLEYINEPF